jgi:hypothetical protein
VKVNQKYKMTSSYIGTPPTQGTIGGINEPGDWIWQGVSMDQWCISDFTSDLTNNTNNVDVEYVNVPSKPSTMPGQYMNGDLIPVELADGYVIGNSFLAKHHQLLPRRRRWPTRKRWDLYVG